MPKAGDILLADGSTVEIKSNKSELDSISKSQCKYGIHSGPSPTNLGHPPEGFVIGITILKKKSNSSSSVTQYGSKQNHLFFNIQHLLNLNEDIKSAVGKSGIFYSKDISINFLELLFGDMNYGPAIPVLQDCILLPKIEPDFM